MADQFTISEVCICEAAKVWKEDGEILATGIGLLPRIAVGLAKKLHNPDLMIMRSGLWSFLASPTAILGNNPIPVAKISPSSFQTFAASQMHTSLIVN